MLAQGGHAVLTLMSLLLLLWHQAAPIEVPQDRKSLRNHLIHSDMLHVCENSFGQKGVG